MSDATSIQDLPTDPIGGPGGNITMTAQEQPHVAPSSPPPSNGMTLDQSTISQIVSGLQQATMTGSTQLPSRDIPMTTSRLTTDPQVVPTFVPPPPAHHTDYIQQYETPSTMAHQYNQRKQMHTTLDAMYDEIQTPLLLAVLYFLFQLPAFKRLFYQNLRFLFDPDGNYNLTGFVCMSVLFGLLFHLLIKLSAYVNR